MINNLIIFWNLLNTLSEKMNYINYTKFGKWKHLNNLERMELKIKRSTINVTVVDFHFLETM
jgi:hypothetical protein